MVKDVEGTENKTGSIGHIKSTPSVADCWRWLKGLLYDFIQIKNKNDKLLI
jgi:hypothetical protein